MSLINPILERNLRALTLASGPAAQAIFRAEPRTDVEFVETEDGVLSALLGAGAQARQLASRRRPIEEAERLAATVPVETTAGVAVLGMGLGYHAKAVADRLKSAGLVVVFEPDVGLLRAVLERIDHSTWLARGNVRLLIDADDQGAIAAALSGFEGVVALGTRLLEHPASRARLAEAGPRFSAQFTSVMKSVRTNVVTTLVQMEATIRNLLMNVDHYSSAAGIADLRGAAKGKPAIVVSAGPSLRRNIDLLSRPGVRDRVVIIAAQTVLKPLLAKGIRPHFVTALDYHEISRRFYEGLTASDVEGVTLVVEPKANPAILDAFPGQIRCVADNVLNVVMGEQLRREMGELRAGATVAHLAYYLARHLSCDPVILIGQDLGFTDGQYYAAGAAIHQVWSGELNEFRTLEMMEWERIVRGRHVLRKAIDTLGRPVYTDEQMATYLVQFERDFAADARAGLTIIDATEGGVAKNHTTVMTLVEALETFAGGRDLFSEGKSAAHQPTHADNANDSDGMPVPSLDAMAASMAGRAPRRERASRARVVERVQLLRAEVWRIEGLSRKSASVLERMLACHADQARVNRLIAEVHGLRGEAVQLTDAYWLVHHLNQTGTLKRFRKDRSIELEPGLPALEQQKRQIERDIENVRWLADSAAQMGQLLDDTVAALMGGPKAFRDPAMAEPTSNNSAASVGAGSASMGSRGQVEQSSSGTNGVRVGPDRSATRVAAVMIVDPDRGGLGTPRDLAFPVAGGQNALRMTVARLARCEMIDEVVLVTDEPERVRALAGPAPAGIDLTVRRTDIADRRARARAAGVSRLFAPACWRGAIGGLSAYDEAFDAAVVAPVMEELGLDAAVIVGADWALVDPALTDECVRRHLERAAANRVTFAQAPPGLAGCVLARSLVNELASARNGAGPFASIGGLLGYIPIAPQTDPIAKLSCVTVSPVVRDMGLRCIPDSAARRAWISAMVQNLGDNSATASADDFARAVAGHAVFAQCRKRARHIVVELTSHRTHATTASLRSRWHDGRLPSGPAMDWDTDRLRDRLAGLRGDHEDAVLTFAGRGDPLSHPRWRDALAAARVTGFAAVHVRTDLVGGPEDLDALLGANVDVVSVDLLATKSETYQHIAGHDGLDRAAANVRSLLARRSRAGGLPSPWIVPRITRCDLVYDQIEAFYDRWLMETGACVIDALPRPITGDRIEPLPWPAGAEQRRAAEIVLLSANDAVARGAQADTPAPAATGATIPATDMELKERLATPQTRAA